MISKTAVILAFDTLGDLTLRQPLFTGLLDAGYAVTVVTRRSFAGVLPFLDARLSSIPTDCNPYAPIDPSTWAEVERLRGEIDARIPSILISAPYNRTYLDELICWQTPCETVGFSHPDNMSPVLDLFLPKADPRHPPGEFRFSRGVEISQNSHECEKSNALLKAVLGQPLKTFEPRIQLPPGTEHAALVLLEKLGLRSKEYAFGCPAGTAHVSIKAWPPADYADAVAHLFVKHQLKTLITGLPAEDPVLSKIVTMGSEKQIPILKWLGNSESLGLMLGLIRHSKLYLGTDSGPMHFAGALGVPVVAQFGGGTWPRFLPMARRALVATQKVPCFGCYWDCWLDESICITRVAPSRIRAGIDWILSSDPDARRIDEGEDPGRFFGEMITRGSAKHRTEHEAVHRRFFILEADRAARLEVIQDLAKKLEVSQADLAQKTAEIAANAAEIAANAAEIAAKTVEISSVASHLAGSEAECAARLDVINQMTARMQIIEADRAARLEHIYSLQRTIAMMSTTRWAAKRLIAGVLRKLGLYDLAVHMRDGAGHARSNATHPSPQAQPAPVSPIESPLVEAFIIARSLPGDTGDAALEHLFEIGAEKPRVLCPETSERNLQCLCMLSNGGARITALSALNRTIAKGSSSAVAVEHETLPQWMISRAQNTLRDFDLLLLDAGCSQDLLRFLRGRLWEGTRIFVQGTPEEEASIHTLWGEPEREIGGVRIFQRVPESFLDPAQKCPEIYSAKDWPKIASIPRLPPSMPSGRPWPKITVVTVTFNQADYLEETLRSVLNQGYPNLEYIVLDGKSTDGTQSILDRYRDSLSFCVSEKDEGQSDALNKGFARSTGDILAWLNSDDRYLPETLMRVALAFDNYDTDVVAGGCILVQNKNLQPFSTHHNSLPLGQVVPLPLDRLLDVEGSWIKGDFFWQPEVFWTRGIWERAGGKVAKDLYYSMDYDLWVRMAQRGARIVHLPDSLAIYRLHENQKTSGDQPPYLPELREVSGAYLKGLR